MYSDQSTDMDFHVAEGLGPVMEALRDWEAVTGSTLKPSKCIVLPVPPPPWGQIESFVQSVPGFASAELAGVARYLGVMGGVEAAASQWTPRRGSTRARPGDLAGRRLDRHETRVLQHALCRHVEVPRPVRRAVVGTALVGSARHPDCHPGSLANFPYRFAPQFARFGIPRERIGVDHMARAAMTHTCMVSPALRDGSAAFDAACLAETAPLAALRNDALWVPVRR